MGGLGGQTWGTRSSGSLPGLTEPCSGIGGPRVRPRCQQTGEDRHPGTQLRLSLSYPAVLGTQGLAWH